MKVIKLSTDLRTLDKLYQKGHGRKATVSIKAQDLLNLCMDHSKMFDALTRECNVSVKEDKGTSVERAAL